MTVCRLCSTEHSPGDVHCPGVKPLAPADPQDPAFAATNVAAPAAPTNTAAPAVATSTYLRNPSAAAGLILDVSDELPVGTVIGYWTITRKLGEGGMGAVYAATAEDIGTTVAVKVLSFPGWRKPEAQAPFANAKERFHREAKAASKLKHPNVIGILAYGSLPDGRPYFVMEYLPGRSLDARLLEDPPQGIELLRLLSQVCDALTAIHLEGIVHRDLKPENIWVVEPKQGETSVKLLDFGISKMEGMAKLTETGGHAGTVYYESPEQLDGKNIGPRSDIYSFGAVLFEMFTGHLLFGEQSLAKTFHDILFAEPPPLVARAPYSISPALDRLKKKPEERPQSAQELKDRLRGVLGAEPTAPFKLAPTEIAPVLSTSKHNEPGPATSLLVANVSKGRPIKVFAALLILALGGALFVASRPSVQPKVTPVALPSTSAVQAPISDIQPPAAEPKIVREPPPSPETPPGAADRRASQRRPGPKANVTVHTIQGNGPARLEPSATEPEAVTAPPPPPSPTSVTPTAPPAPAPEPSRPARHRPLLPQKPELIYKDLRTNP
jgi:serine/threonine-protein kinase